MTNYNIVLWLQYGGGGNVQPGRQSEWLQRDGWKKSVAGLKPQLDWAGPKAAVCLHHPFGNFTHEMRFDSYDYAKAISTLPGEAWRLDDFVEAWKPVCKERPVFAYLGGTDVHQELNSLPHDEFVEMVRRNVEPYYQAGFAGVAIDATYDAVFIPYTLKTGQQVKPSRDAFTLALIDDTGWFPVKAGIEPTPRKFAPWAPLHDRPCWAEETVWQNSRGSDRHADVGFGKDTSYLTGRIHRIVYQAHYKTPQEMADYCRTKIVAEGHVPCVPAWWLMNAVKVEEVTGGKK